MSQDKYFLRILSFSLLFLTLSLVRANADVTVSCTLPSAQVGVSYVGGSCTASGGTSPYTFSVVGSLPPGLGLSAPTDTSTAVTGTPTTAGATFSFSISAVDSSATPVTGTAAETMTVSPAALTLTCTAPLAAQVGVAYTGSCGAGGGTPPYTYSVTGAAPIWLSINAATGAITGTPTGTGTYSFTLMVTDAASQSQTQAVTNLVVFPAALTLACTAPLAAQVGVAYTGSCGAGGGTPPYTYSVTGAAPTWLSINAATGAITGTPTGTGTYSFALNVTDAGSQTQTQAVTNLVVSPAALTLTCTAPLAAQVGVAYTGNCAAGGGTTPYTYSVTGAAPTWLSINASTGAITGTPTGTGTYSFTLKVTDAASNSQTQAVTNLVVSPAALTLMCTAPLAAQVGVAYTGSCTAAGGTTPYTYSVTGAAPVWLSINASTGAITGTPTATGTYSFTLNVTDAASNSQTQAVTNLVVSPAALTLTCTAPLAAQVGVGYSGSCTAAGGTPPYTYSVTGAAPTWLSINSATGAITGTPTSTGTYSFTLNVTDSGSQSQTQAVANLVVSPAALTLTCNVPLAAQVGVAYAGGSCTGGGGTSPYTYSISAGALPGGIALNSSTGAITGTPSAAGTFSFTVKVVDSGSTAQSTTQAISNFSVAPATLTLSCAAPGQGIVGAAYSANCNGAGGTTPYTYSISSGTLPNGLTFNTSNGSISGTLTTAGTFTFTVKVTDAGNPAQSATQSETVNVIPTLSITTTQFGNGIVGISYSATCNATGGTTPYTFSISAGALPGGLSLNTSTCGITGTPTASGTFNFSVKATDAGAPSQTATQPLSITINPALVITSTSAPNGSVGLTYAFALTAQNGTAPYSWSLASGSLPVGLNLNSSTGVISGTPTLANTYSFTVKVTDSGSPVQTQTQTFSNVSIAAGLTITTSVVANGIVGSGYSASLTAQNGQAPYTWSISSGSLPGGLSLNGGTISGTPTATGTFSFAVKVTDSTAPTAQVATQALSINISPALIFTSTGYPNGTVGVGYGATCGITGGTLPYNFSITSGALPAGLSLNATNCTINGTPSGSNGTFNFTLKATDSGNPVQTVSQAFSLTVGLGLTITSSSVPSGATGQPYSFTLGAQNGTAPYTWVVTAGALPTGLSLSANGTISGTPTVVGTYSFTVKVIDSGSPSQSATQNFTNVSVASGLTITSNGTLGAATQSTAYSATLTAANGTGNLTWALGNGSALPAGLSLSSSGVISGTPTAPGTTTFSVKVTDSGNPQQAASQIFSLTVNPFTAPVVPTFTFSLPSTSETPGVSLSGATIGVSPVSSIGWLVIIDLNFKPNATGVSTGYIDPSLQFLSSSAPTGMTCSSTTECSVTIPANASSEPLPQIAPGTVAGQISLTLSVDKNVVATSSLTVPPSVPIITPGSVQILNVTSSGFDVELIANSSPRDLKTATFSFSAASGTSISGTTSFSVDVSSLMTSWYAGTTSQQYGSAFSLTVPFTFSGNSAAIAAVTVTLTNSVGASSPVTGTN